MEITPYRWSIGSETCNLHFSCFILYCLSCKVKPEGHGKVLHLLWLLSVSGSAFTPPYHWHITRRKLWWHGKTHFVSLSRRIPSHDRIFASLDCIFALFFHLFAMTIVYPLVTSACEPIRWQENRVNSAAETEPCPQLICNAWWLNFFPTA